MPRSKTPPEISWDAMYQCPECEEILEERRCDNCNKFALAIWAFECPKCNEYVTGDEL